MAEKALKTSQFRWEGTDRKGTKVKGEITGQNPALVKAQLRKQGINPQKVRKKSISLFSAGKKIKPQRFVSGPGSFSNIEDPAKVAFPVKSPTTAQIMNRIMLL